MVSTYEDAKGNYITVPGIIMAVNKHVMKTDGITIDTALGKGYVLDKYAQNLQDEEVRSKMLANDSIESQIKREEIGQQIVKNKDDAGAKDFQIVFYPPSPKSSTCEESEEDNERSCKIKSAKH